MAEDKLQVSALEGDSADFSSREAGNGLCSCLLNQLLIQGGVYAPCKRPSKLDKPGSDILL